MIVSMLEAPIVEVDRCGRSSVEVAPSNPVMLLGNSSAADMLDTIASVVVGDETIPLKTAVLEAIASISVLSTLVKIAEADSSSLVGNKVGDAGPSEIEIVVATSVGRIAEPSRMLLVLSIPSVRLSSTTNEVVAAGEATSVGVIKPSIIVL